MATVSDSTEDNFLAVEKIADGKYGADDLSHLEGLEAVRKKPGMYIGDVYKRQDQRQRTQGGGQGPRGSIL